MLKRMGAPYDRAGLGIRQLSALLLALGLASGSGYLDARAANEQDPMSETSTDARRLDLSIHGQIGGTSEALEIDGHYAFVSVGMRLVVFDITVSSAPKIVGRSPILSGTIEAIQVRDGFVYVVGGDAGLSVLDVSNPESPQLVGGLAIDGYSLDVSVEGDLAFVIQRPSGTRPTSNLVVVDLTIPALPRVVGHLDLPGGAAKIEASGDMVYVSDYWWIAASQEFGGLRVVDVTEPSAPRLAGRIAMTPMTDMTVVERLGYAVGDLVLYVLDLSAPASPRISSSLVLPGRATAVVVQGGLAYVAGGDQGLLVVDIAAPSAPRILGRASFGPASLVDVAGTLAFVVDDQRGLRVFDVADPTAPRFLAAAADLSGTAYTVQVVNQLAYVPSGTDLQVIDVSAPSEPRLVGSVAVRGRINLRVVGNLAYVCGGEVGTLQIVDVTLPSKPHILGSVDGLVSPFAVDIVGDLAYVADLARGLMVVDVSMPSTPRVIGGIATIKSPSDVEVSGGLAYLATENGLQVVDISEPRSPQVVGRADFSAAEAQVRPWTVNVDGTLAYVGGHSNQDGKETKGVVAVVDVAVPSAPRVVGLLELPPTNAIPNISVMDKLVYVADRDVGLQVVDATVPSAMRMVANFAGLEAWDVDVVDGLAVVAGGHGGVVVLGTGDDPTGAGHVAWLPFLAAALPLR